MIWVAQGTVFREAFKTADSVLFITQWSHSLHNFIVNKYQSNHSQKLDTGSAKSTLNTNDLYKSHVYTYTHDYKKKSFKMPQ